jgi:NAD(P)-dependent dehydrogenase (short-subunit alcohol dehydrogenase family)
MENTQAKTWFITGCSRGIGFELARMVLEKGGNVVATARERKSLDPLLLVAPGHCLGLDLDVRDIAAIPEAVKMGIDRFGRIDVLVNNAGYGLQGTVEEVSMAQLREQMETNFFGLFALCQTVAPYMRKQKGGWIVNVSSMAGMRGMATFGAYNASKFAVEGMTEALAAEMAPFGVRVSAIEPGPYRTDWAGSSLERSEAMSALLPNSPYSHLNSQFKEMLDSRSGKQPGDPKQIASVLIEAADAPKAPLHMVFGDVAIQAVHDRQNHFSQPEFIRYFPHDEYNF